MKIQDIDKVNHLIGELNSMKALIAHAENADPTECELFIKLPGDLSIRLSSEGAASTHYQGFSASSDFLRRLHRSAVEELEARRRGSSMSSRRWGWTRRREQASGSNSVLSGKGAMISWASSLLSERQGHVHRSQEISGASRRERRVGAACSGRLRAADAGDGRVPGILPARWRPDVLIAISMFDSADEAVMSNEKAADWVRNNVMEFARGMPEVMVGDALIAEVKDRPACKAVATGTR